MLRALCLCVCFVTSIPAPPRAPEALHPAKRGVAILDFEAGPAVEDGAPWTPKGWTRTGPPDSVRAVVRSEGGGHAVGLLREGALEISFQIAAPPREAADLAYDLLIGLDVLDYPGSGTHQGAVQVRVAVDEEKEALREVRFPTPRAAKSAASQSDASTRHWLYLEAKLADRLIGKSLHLRLAAAEGGRAVVDAVEVVRVPVTPTWKHLGRSNGGLGPDQLGQGALGFDALTEHDQSPLAVVEVRKGTPAELAGLRAGDVIVGVNGRPFPRSDLDPGPAWASRSHEAVLSREVARIYDQAAGKTPPPMHLEILREGEPKRVECRLPVRPALSAEFPYGDRADAALVADLLRHTLAQQKKNGSFGDNVVRTGLGVLALLGTRDKKHLPAASRAMKWLIERHDGPEDRGLAYWSIGYTGIAIGEYVHATGDQSLLRWAKRAQRLCLAGQHTSAFGMTSLGHGPDGLPYENKALIAPLAHLLAFEALVARKGVAEVLWPTFEPFVLAAWSDPKEKGHGAMGYNASYRDDEEFWSRTGLCLAALTLRQDRPDMREGMIAVMRKRHEWMLNSHAYGEPGAAWGLMGLALADRDAFNEVIRAWRWKFEGAWEPGYGLRYTTPHMGSPYMGEDDLINIAYLALFSVRQQGLLLTGAKDGAWAEGVVPPILETDFPASREPGTNGSPTVLRASGAKTESEAVARAARAVDGDPVLAWRTDSGHESSGYPHHLELDLGKAVRIPALEFGFAEEDLSPAQIRVLTSADGKAFQPEGEPHVLGAWKADARIVLNPVPTKRYLRLEFVTPRVEGRKGLAIRELRLGNP